MAGTELRTFALRLERGITRFETWLVGISLFGLLSLSLAQILARNLFHTGLPGIDALMRHLVLYVTFLGAALATESRRHIRVDFLAAWLPARWNHRIHRPAQAFASLVSLYFLQAGLRFWQDGWQHAQAGERGLVLLDLIIPAGFGLLALHFLLCALIGPHPEPEV